MSDGTKAQTAQASKELNDMNAAITGGSKPTSTVFLYASKGATDADTWQRMKFKADLEREFRNAIFAQISSTIENNPDIEPFNFDSSSSHALCYWKKADSTDVSQWVAKIPKPNWPHLFTGDDAFLKKVRFHVTVVQFGKPNVPELMVFTQRSPASLVRKGILAILDVSRNEFQRADKIFNFDPRPDFIVWGDWIFIFSRTKFESLTDIRTVTTSKAKTAIDAFSKKSDIKIEKLAELKKSSNLAPQLARRLAGAAHDKILDQQNGAALEKRIVEKSLKIKCSNSNGIFTFSPDPNDIEQVTEFVNLLADYYLRSPSSGIEYVATSKIRD